LLRSTVDQPLAGRNILVVEDQWLLAEDLREMLLGWNCRVLGPFATVAQTLAALGDGLPRPDTAILDFQLLDGVSLPIAERLAALNVPFVVLSAHAAALDQPELAAAPRLGKPARHDLLRQALIATLDDQVLGTARPGG
jgi:CheY-like chemotaxis protein